MGLLKNLQIEGHFEKIEAIEHLIKYYLEDPAAGIAKLVLVQGEEVLSDKQRHVYERHVLKEYFEIDCSRCHSPIPFGELIGAWENDNLCSWCINQVSKDD
jgi:hypothetical protein